MTPEKMTPERMRPAIKFWDGQRWRFCPDCQRKAFEFAAEFGEHVLAAYRATQNEPNSPKSAVLEGVPNADQLSARQLAEKLQGIPIDDAEDLILEWLNYVLHGPSKSSGLGEGREGEPGLKHSLFANPEYPPYVRDAETFIRKLEACGGIAAKLILLRNFIIPYHANTGEPGRSSAKAVEFGEYLAIAAERFQKTINTYAELLETADRDRDEEIIDEALEDKNGAWKALSAAIYEFRKRTVKS